MAQTSRNKPGVEEFGGSGNAGSGDVAMYKLQNSFEKNRKMITGLVLVVLIAVGGFFGYKYFVQQPNEEKAARAIYKVENWFAADSFNLVINGDGQSQSGLSVIKKFSGTNAANNANFYVGMSYLKTGDFNNAIKYLSEYNGNGTVNTYLAYGALGDAYMEAGKTDKGIEFYNKAASIGEKNPAAASLYTFRAGLANERAGKTEEAKKLYKAVKEKYANTMSAMEIDKYLARVGEVTID